MISLIVGIKDREKHFKQTFPFLISQVGIEYELIYVNFYSEDDFLSQIIKENRRRKKDSLCRHY